MSTTTRNETTPNLGLNKPEVGGDDDVWGDLLNANCDVLDAVVATSDYVNSSLSQYLPLTGGRLTGGLALIPGDQSAPPLNFGSSSSGYYGSGASLYVAAFGTQVFGFSLAQNTSFRPLNMSNQRITVLATPTQPTDAASKSYVDLITSRALLLVGSMNANTGLCRFTATSGFPDGVLPDPAPATLRDFVVVEVAGTPPIGPFQEALNVGDYVVSDGAEWVRVAVGGEAATGDSVILTPPVFGSDVLQVALMNAESQMGGFLPIGGGVLQGTLRLPNGLQTLPALQFGAADGTGFWRTSDFMVLSLQGALSAAFTPNLAQFYAPVSLLGNKIQGLGDATLSTDALNLRTADARYLQQTATVQTDGVSIVGNGTIAAPLAADRIDCGSYTRRLGHEWQAAEISDQQRVNRVLSLRRGPV